MNLNREFAEKVDCFSEGYLDKNPDNVPNYIDSWSLLMPFAVDYGLNIQLADFDLGGIGQVSRYNIYGDETIIEFKGYEESTVREAIMECLIKSMEENKL